MNAVSCPFCQERIVLKLAQIRWPVGCPDKAVYECQSCGAAIPESDRKKMLSGISPEEHLPVLYRSDVTMAQIAREFKRSTGNKAELKKFVTNWMREPWEEEPPCL